MYVKNNNLIIRKKPKKKHIDTIFFSDRIIWSNHDWAFFTEQWTSKDLVIKMGLLLQVFHKFHQPQLDRFDLITNV